MPRTVIFQACSPFKYVEILDYGGSVLVVAFYFTGGVSEGGEPLKPLITAKRRNWHRNDTEGAKKAAEEWVRGPIGAPVPTP